MENYFCYNFTNSNLPLLIIIFSREHRMQPFDICTRCSKALVYFQIFVQDHLFAVAFNNARLNHDDFQTFLQFQIL